MDRILFEMQYTVGQKTDKFTKASLMGMDKNQLCKIVAGMGLDRGSKIAMINAILEDATDLKQTRLNTLRSWKEYERRANKCSLKNSLIY